MLIEFKVGNFLSFKEVVTFSMVASDIDSQDEELDNNSIIKVDEDLGLLKTSAIYGANASGKSNLAKALGFMSWFVINSVRQQITDVLDIEPFRLSSGTENKPSLFEMTFYIDNAIYRYGFELTETEIVKEWLYEICNEEEDLEFFLRTLKGITIKSKFFSEGKGLDSKTKANSLFISVVAEFNGQISRQIIKWFANILANNNYKEYRDITFRLLKKSSILKQEVIQLVKNLDLSIDDIIIESFFEQIIVQTLHLKYNEMGQAIGHEVFYLEKHESEGTKKLFHMSGVILNALKNGHILVIDELDARLHPLITHKIVQLFNSKQYNPNGAQLIFMTHDTNLLNHSLFGSKLLRRDQIWFTEKTQLGATDLYSLAEYDISEDAPFESDYIHGKYGAIPFIGGFGKLLGN